MLGTASGANSFVNFPNLADTACRIIERSIHPCASARIWNVLERLGGVRHYPKKPKYYGNETTETETLFSGTNEFTAMKYKLPMLIAHRI